MTIDRLPTLGHDQADTSLRLLLRPLLALARNLVRSCYVVGSFADGSAVHGSDLDLHIVFDGDRANASAAARRLARAVTSGIAKAPMVIDVKFLHVGELSAGDISLSGPSILLWGVDDRPAIRPPPLPLCKQRIVRWTLKGLTALRADLRSVMPEPTYPAPEEEFYGYVRASSPGEPNSPDASTRPWAGAMLRVATTLLLLERDVLVIDKRSCSALYRQHFGDDWTDYFDSIQATCRTEWQYRVPVAPQDRVRLRSWCGRSVDLERRLIGRLRSGL